MGSGVQAAPPLSPPLLRAAMAESSVLMAASKHIAARCKAENAAFVACKRADADPEACLKQGEKVTGCVLTLLKSLQATCGNDLDAYSKCMYTNTSEYAKCRQEEAAL